MARTKTKTEVVETKEKAVVENKKTKITKEAIKEITAEGVNLSVGEPSVTTCSDTGKLFISAREAYSHAYDNFPMFPANWFVTENFTWNEVFANEKAEDGIPILEVFENAVHTAQQLQAIRNYIKKPILVHCWVRQIPHNKRAGSKAHLSAHINGRAVDISSPGYSSENLNATIASLNLPVRIEAGTKNYSHIDIGNSYTNHYKWGFFNP